MLDFHYIQLSDKKRVIQTTLTGKPLLTTPQLNKGTAFTAKERKRFGLMGKLPSNIETIEEQASRSYQLFLTLPDKLSRNTYLRQLHNLNEVLFYYLVSHHLNEMLPTIYTPIVGSAVKQFSQTFSQTRGLYISYEDRDDIREILDNRSNPEIDIIVVTDGEGVLGLGDMGVGGMDIPVAKLMVYTLCGGIDPRRTLPIFLDVGTNNETLLKNPMYLGHRHKRIRGKDYDNFLDDFVSAVKEKFPQVFLHFEDFGRQNATRLLERYRNQLCTFNDDAQGTGAVALAAILSSSLVTEIAFTDQRIVIFGGGTAGMGITQQLYNAMLLAGLSPTEAKDRFWIVDKRGLLTSDLADLTPEQIPFARSPLDVADWVLITAGHPGLLEIVVHVKPTVLIGCSGAANAFSRETIATMAKHVQHPTILPLSNPTECCEAQPADIIKWTEGRALIATGTPFDPVEYNGEMITIPQCNNALIFPAIGLGITVTKATRLSDGMLWAACQALAKCSPVKKDPTQPLLPSLEKPLKNAKKIALAVAKQAIAEKLGTWNDANGELKEAIADAVWEAEYLPLVLE